MIIEGIITTLNDDGSANVAPMGPEVDEQLTRFTLRPFQTSRTYANLKRSRRGVMHVIDDVELLARAAVNQLESAPATRPLPDGQGLVLQDACRWFLLRISAIDDQAPRATMECEVLREGRIRDFFGWNRAKHAVVEAAILATRVDFLPPWTIQEEMVRLQPLVDKTGGPQERRAFAFLLGYIQQTRPTQVAQEEL